MGGEDEVVGSRASFGCDGFGISKEGEEEHLEDLVELVASIFGISRESAMEKIFDEAEARLEVKVGWEKCRTSS